MIMRTPQRRHQRGATYVEAIVAAALILITLLPMLDAIQGASVSVGAHEQNSVQHARAIALMEEVIAEPVTSLETQIAAGAATATAAAAEDAAEPEEVAEDVAEVAELFGGEISIVRHDQDCPEGEHVHHHG